MNFDIASLFTFENFLLTGSIILIAAVLLGKTSYRTGLPTLLIFLLVGMLFGVDGLGLEFGDMHAAQFTGMIALCVILFSGGMDTKLSAIKPVLAPGLVLSTVGVFITALVTGLFVWWLSGMSWTNIHFAFMPSLLLAATMSSTDSASVFGILSARKVYLKENLRPMLELESGSNDPMAYMLTIILIDVITLGGDFSGGALVMQLLMQFGVGTVLGYGLGKATIWLAQRYRRIGGRDSEDADQASSMLSIMVLAATFLTFAITTELGGNGYLAVYICGIVTGNSDLPLRRSIGKFTGGISWLMQIVMFIMLGLLVNPHELVTVAPVSILIGLFIIVAGRPLSVFLSLAPFHKISFKARLFVSWVGLRGAVPIIFATYPVVADIPGAGNIFNIVFFVTLLSLLVQGTTLVWTARKLGLESDETTADDSLGVELPEDMTTSLKTITLTPADLEHANTLRDMLLPAGTLVMVIKRGERFIVPNGTRRLLPGDKLLMIKESDR